jgi:predicted dehydrogenase
MAAVKAIVVGTGGMARYHIDSMLAARRATTIVGLVEPAAAAREATKAVFDHQSAWCPPFYDTVGELIKSQGAPEVALICTPHKFHFENARDCMLSGADVCLEKPMVMNASEARRLIRLQRATKRLVVVAFPGSLSPAIRKAKQLIARGAIGNVTAISAFAHQDWKSPTTGTWRQVPEMSGGGFLFDTGSHMVNTVVDLLGEDVAAVTALLDNRGTPVEITAAVSGRSRSGVMFCLNGVGDSIQCKSQVMVFGDRGLLQTGIWGECLLVKTAGQPEFKPVPYPPSRGIWEQFLKVRRGALDNPCPPAVGLRFATLMDMVRRSAATGRTIAASTSNRAADAC